MLSVTCTLIHSLFLFFFFNDPATTEIYTLSLHDALPISAIDLEKTTSLEERYKLATYKKMPIVAERGEGVWIDRKSTRLNSSHMSISYAVFCLKKKKKKVTTLEKSIQHTSSNAH